MNEEQKIRRATYHLWTFGFSKLISTFGNSIYVFGISLYILTLTGSAMNFAVNMLCSVLPRTILAPFVGYMADRYSKKALIIISQLSSLLIVIGLLMYSIWYGISLLAIYITTVLLTISSMFTGITFTSSITRLIDRERIQKAMSLNQMSVSISAIGGPVVGGMLFAFAPIEAFLTIFIAAFIVAVILEATMNFRLFEVQNENQITEKESFWQGMGAGIKYVMNQRVLKIIFTVAIFINFFAASLTIGLPYLLIEQLQINAAHFGMIEGIFAGGLLVGALYFMFRKEVQFPLISVKFGIISYGLLIILMVLPLMMVFPYWLQVSYYSLLALSIGFALTYTNTPIGVMMQKMIDEDLKGRVFGILETIAQALMPISVIIYGMLYDQVGPFWVLISSGVCVILLTVFLIRPSIIKSIYPEKYGLSIPVPEISKTDVEKRDALI
ncbi:MFS transporter [Alkalihalobacillus pseudalcaliphilus]|uniref:MFS transporter n=1 Tax=Alkalihalobacillus pseudalcaliphilus TaxID=79884 RepID=UPI00064DFF21|nr:MFS transporter [Alkalihalobacillus pseudalcaliphilus]KMK76212.1 permease [Alkalihalobacillus pseudalcaliphilus]